MLSIVWNSCLNHFTDHCQIKMTPRVGTFSAGATCRNRSTPRPTKPTSKQSTVTVATRRSGARLVSSTTRSTSTATRLTRTLAPFASTLTFLRFGMISARCTSPATIRQAMRSTHTPELLISIPPTSTSRRVLLCLRDSPQTAFLTKPVHLFPRMFTLRLTSQVHLVDLQVNHGVDRRTTALLPDQHRHPLPLVATGEATGLQSCRTLHHRRLRSISMTTEIACRSRSLPWHPVDPVHLARIPLDRTRSLSAHHHPLTAASLLLLRTSSPLLISQRLQTSHLSILRSGHRSRVLPSRRRSSSSRVKVHHHFSAKVVRRRRLLRTAFSRQRATLQSQASTAHLVLALKSGLLSTTLRLRLVVDSQGPPTSITRTRACRRLPAERRHLLTRSSPLTLPRVKGRRGPAALPQSASVSGKMTRASRDPRPRSHVQGLTRSRCNAHLLSLRRSPHRPIVALLR